MLLQQRNFVRQKSQTTYFLQTKKNYISAKSYFNNRGRKLTVHKAQKCMLAEKSLPNNITPIGLWVIQKVSISAFGNLQNLLLINARGVCTASNPVLGLYVGDLVRSWVWQENRIVSLAQASLSIQKPLSMSYVSTKNYGKKYGTASGHTVIFHPNGSLVLLLGNKVNLSQITGCIGIPSSLSKKQIGVTSLVRGIAKNPVDHPNGGRANTKGSFKTPWGSWAKANK